MAFFMTNLFQPQRNLPTLNVTMLGPRNVGKTSLLAAMYDQFDNVSRDLQLVPDEDTQAILTKRLEELKNFVGDSLTLGDGVSPTQGEPREYKFEFGLTGANPSLEIKFQDYPGGWLVEQKAENLEKVKTFIQQSAAVLIPIETAALMEKKGQYHEKFNQPTQLNELFKKVYKNLDSPRLIILVPLKCEAYMDNSSELFTQVRKGYQKLLNQFASERLLPKVAVAIAPVQTVGSVVFSRIKDENNEPIIRYSKRQPDDPYQPKNTDIPLRYLLRFLLKLHFDKRRGSVFTRILDSFGNNASFRKAVISFANTNSDALQIIQGADLFKM